MNYSALIADGKIRSEPSARRQVGRQLRAAKRDLATAKRLGAAEEWSFNIAYNAMLLAGRAVMFSEGYRPATGEGGHAAVIEFLRIRFGTDLAQELDVMDRMRRQRHRIAYEGEGIVSESAILEAIETAQKFVATVEMLLRKPAPEKS